MSGIDTLLQFKSYIESCDNASKDHSFYYTLWVEKFLIYLEEKKTDEEFSRDDMAEFLRFLAADDKYVSWQIRQAGQSLCLFLRMMQNFKTPKVPKSLVTDSLNVKGY